MNEKFEELLKKLELIKNGMESKVENTQEELNKVNKSKDTKTYADGEEEIKRRQEELKELNDIIEGLKKDREKINNNQIKGLSKELKEKEEKLNETKEAIKNIDKNKDSKEYQEAQEELKEREKEFKVISAKVKEQEEKIENAEKKIKSVASKYKIKLLTVEREELNKKLSEKQKELKKIRAEISNNNEKMTVEQKEKVEELLKEIRDLKSKIKETEESKQENKKVNLEKNKENKRKIVNSRVTDEDLDRYSELLQKGYAIDSPEMLNFYKEIYTRNNNNNLKYPLRAIDNTEKKYPLTKVEDNEKQQYPKYAISDDKNVTFEAKKDETKYEIVTKDTLKIEYNGENNYYKVNNIANTIPAIKFKNKKEKIEYIETEFTEDEITEIFGSEKSMKKIMRKCDPQLLTLLADQNMDYAVKYVEKLTDSKEDVKDELPYEMKYNLKGMRKNHKNNHMSIFQRFKVNSMAKKNKYVAEYIPDDKPKGLLAIPIVGALVAGGLAIANHFNKDKEDPTVTKQDPATVEPAPNIETSNNEMNKDDQIVNTNEINVDNNNRYTGDLILGSKVELQPGVTYTENSLGQGVNAEIGQFSYRPAGEYTVDRAALYYNGKLLRNIGEQGANIDKIAQELASNLGVEKSEIIQVAHVCLGKDHEGPTGWISQEDMNIEDIKANICEVYEDANKNNSTENVVEDDLER